MSDSGKAVFLSYASQDADAARRICEALRTAGIEVWFDSDGGLEHGDEWDAKIRRQIKECVLFLPIISANTQARHEGYFRIEWDLAAERARGIASGVPFILPVVIDETREPEALVPDRFRSVQWTKLPLRPAQGGPVGEIPPEVTQRFLKLWAQSTGGATPRVAPVSDRRNTEEKAIPAGPSPAPRIWFVAATVLVAVAVAALIWQPWKRSASAGSTAAVPNSTVPTSRPEVAALIQRARSFADKTDVLRTELDTATSLLEQASKLDPSDATVWATWALVDRRYVTERFDASAARRDSARTHATKAVGLGRENVWARYADAASMSLLSADPATKQAAIAVLEQVADKISPGPRRCWIGFRNGCGRNRGCLPRAL
jgi:hypothetical protein